MKVLEASMLGREIESLCLEVSTRLPPDVLAALQSFKEAEKSERGRGVLDLIIENARVARESEVALCQDTGIFTVYLSLGRDTAVNGDLVAEASAAVARATGRGSLRASVVEHPLGERINTGDNTPALIEVEITGGEKTTLGVLAKGGGSEMASRSTMLAPGSGWEGVREFVLSVVERFGAGACPPLVLGLGVGGAFDRAPAIAKRALMEPLDLPPRDGATAEREADLLRAVNGLGIGPGAFGGTTTCIGVRVAEAPCHMACLPVALSVNCHALRRKVIEI